MNKLSSLLNKVRAGNIVVDRFKGFVKEREISKERLRGLIQSELDLSDELDKTYKKVSEYKSRIETLEKDLFSVKNKHVLNLTQLSDKNKELLKENKELLRGLLAEEKLRCSVLKNAKNLDLQICRLRSEFNEELDKHKDFDKSMIVTLVTSWGIFLVSLLIITQNYN